MVLNILPQVFKIVSTKRWWPVYAAIINLTFKQTVPFINVFPCDRNTCHSEEQYFQSQRPNFQSLASSSSTWDFHSGILWLTDGTKEPRPISAVAWRILIENDIRLRFQAGRSPLRLWKRPVLDPLSIRRLWLIRGESDTWQRLLGSSKCDFSSNQRSFFRWQQSWPSFQSLFGVGAFFFLPELEDREVKMGCWTKKNLRCCEI